jgi:hypothetical protein
LTPGLERLELGQRFITIFELVEFERDRHVTIRTNRARGVFGDVAVTYLIEPRSESASRLLVKLVYRPRGPGPLGRLYAAVLPWGDLVMMRKQLMTLRDLAERDARTPS